MPLTESDPVEASHEQSPSSHEIDALSLVTLDQAMNEPSSGQTSSSTPADDNVLMYDADDDDDGAVDTRETWTYNAAGKVLTDERDSCRDHRKAYTYDTDGNLQTYEYDSDADGTVDGRSTYTRSGW